MVRLRTPPPPELSANPRAAAALAAANLATAAAAELMHWLRSATPDAISSGPHSFHGPVDLLALALRYAIDAETHDPASEFEALRAAVSAHIYESRLG